MTSRARILEADKRHVFRPFTPVEDHASEDSLVVVSGEGPYLVDADGSRYFDASGAWWCNHLGFQHPRIVAALRDQAAHLCHAALAGATHESAALLAEELVKVAPAGLDRVFYTDNGSTAVEVAAKLAFQYWQQNGRPERRIFLTLSGGYHGDTVGAMSLGGVESFHRVFSPLMFEVRRAPDVMELGSFEAVIGWMLDVLAKEGDRIAGVVIEPMVQAAAGMRFYDAGLLRALREATHRSDTFLILDEVFTGFGRTGPMWAADHAGISPDLLCTAKGLSAGALPFGAVLVSERVYHGFGGGPGRAFLHGHTFCGNPLGARVALEVLATYRDESVLARGAENAAHLRAAMARFERIDGVRNPRAFGSIAAFEVGPSGYFGRLGWAVEREARKHGVALRPLGNTVYVVPPLITSTPDLDFLLAGVEAAVRSVLLEADLGGKPA